MILLDTNVLVRMTDSINPQCAAARQAVHKSFAKRGQPVVVPQNLYEFWAVATRKPGPPLAGQNGLGMTAERASQWLRILPTPIHASPRSGRTACASGTTSSGAYGILGLKSYDARLVAAMQSYGITRLLTFNTDHFRSLPITLLDPASL